MKMAAVLLSLLLSLGLVSAYDVVGQISTTQQLSPDFSKAKVVLNDGLYSSLVTTTGHFKIEDVPAGKKNI